MKKLSNWSKTMIVLIAALVLMLNPLTRSIVLTILPLGSGVDDLIFFAVFFAAVVVLMMKAITPRDLLNKIAEWFMK